VNVNLVPVIVSSCVSA